MITVGEFDASRLVHFLLPFPQADPWAATVFVDEFDALSLKRPLKRFNGSFLEFFAPFEPCAHRIDRHFGRGGKLSNTEAKRSTSHPALDREHNHNTVTILVDKPSCLTIITLY